MLPSIHKAVGFIPQCFPGQGGWIPSPRLKEHTQPQAPFPSSTKQCLSVGRALGFIQSPQIILGVATCEGEGAVDQPQPPRYALAKGTAYAIHDP